MRISETKIATRLGLLGVFFLLALLAVAFGGWRAMTSTSTLGAAALQRTAHLTEAIDHARAGQVEFKKQVQAWKDTLLRGNEQAGFDKYSAEFKTQAEITRARLAAAKADLDKLGVSTPLFEQATSALDNLNKDYAAALAQYDVAKPESAHIVDQLVKGKDRPPTAKIDEIVAFIQKQAQDTVAAAVKEQEAAAHSTMLGLLGVLLATAIVGAAIMVWLVRTITSRLAEAVEVAQTVADGDLSTEVHAEGTDEIGILLGAMKNMHDSLADIVGRVRVGTEAIAFASSEIATGNQDLSARTEEQASSLEETASSMDELTATVRNNNEHASTASKLAGTASEVAVRGGAAVAQVVQTMDSINESSRKIVDIIGVIDGIAFQTNILALNAAVEAARAGEQGRGFAVVASEVRNLAQRSAAAAKDIKALIGASVEKVENGTRLVGQAGATINEVVESVQRVTSIISEIAQASDEQNVGIDQINSAITQMDAATQQNAALVEQASAAAEALQHQAQELKQAVSVFKIDPARMPKAQVPVKAAPLRRPAPLVAAPLRRPAAAPQRAPAEPLARAARPAASRPAMAAPAAGSDDWEEF